MKNKKSTPPAGMKKLSATRRAVGKVVGKVAGPKAEYKYLAKKADYATKSGQLYRKAKKK